MQVISDRVVAFLKNSVGPTDLFRSGAAIDLFESGAPKAGVIYSNSTAGVFPTTHHKPIGTEQTMHADTCMHKQSHDDPMQCSRFIDKGMVNYYNSPLQLILPLILIM